MTRPSNATPDSTGATMREWSVNPTFTGAGAAVPVLIRGVGLVTSAPFTRQGVGLYTLFLQDTGAILAAFRGLVHTAATVAPMVAKYSAGSFVRSVSPQTKGSVQIEFWNMVATPALADPPAASLVDLEIVFYDNIVSP